ncbi:hypothetical protein pb186bvf_005780 [Paramecium bursaria]
MNSIFRMNSLYIIYFQYIYFCVYLCFVSGVFIYQQFLGLIFCTDYCIYKNVPCLSYYILKNILGQVTLREISINYYLFLNNLKLMFTYYINVPRTSSPDQGNKLINQIYIENIYPLKIEKTTFCVLRRINFQEFLYYVLFGEHLEINEQGKKQRIVNNLYINTQNLYVNSLLGYFAQLKCGTKSQINLIQNIIFMSQTLEEYSDHKSSEHSLHYSDDTILKKPKRIKYNYSQKKRKPKTSERKCFKFSQDEDERLLNLVLNTGPKFQKIAKYFPGKTLSMVKNRFYKYLRYHWDKVLGEQYSSLNLQLPEDSNQIDIELENFYDTVDQEEERRSMLNNLFLKNFNLDLFVIQQ